ncbi:unnamed protein product [Moneuplotes crassus]|uniref:Uncharacterized protein n=1 Tax=Euplotes crassus TaxID=5936 RepID=A0AAD1UBU8_EUPCR|nr:unnamed protein product [Moneuplotes crassus]
MADSKSVAAYNYLPDEEESIDDLKNSKFKAFNNEGNQNQNNDTHENSIVNHPQMQFGSPVSYIGENDSKSPLNPGIAIGQPILVDQENNNQHFNHHNLHRGALEDQIHQNQILEAAGQNRRQGINDDAERARSRTRTSKIFTLCSVLIVFVALAIYVVVSVS